MCNIVIIGLADAVDIECWLGLYYMYVKINLVASEECQLGTQKTVSVLERKLERYAGIDI